MTYEKPKPTETDKDRGYQVCVKCLNKVHILQAGFECRHVICEKCDASVVIKSEFFDGNRIN